MTGATSLTPTYTSTLADADNIVTLTMTVTSTNACASQTATATFVITIPAIPTNLYVNSAYTSATTGWQCDKFATLASAFATATASTSPNTITLESNLIQAVSIAIPVSDQLKIASGVSLVIPSGVILTIPQTGGLANYGTLTIENGGATTSAEISGGNNFDAGKTIVDAGGTVTDFGSVFIGATGSINPTAGSLETTAAGMTVPAGSQVTILEDFGVGSGDMFNVNGTLTNSTGKTTTVAGTLHVAQTTGRLNNGGHFIIGGSSPKGLHVEGTWAGELPTGSGTQEFTSTSTVEVANLTELNGALGKTEVPNIKMVADISTPAMIAPYLGQTLDGGNHTLATTISTPTAGCVMQMSDKLAAIGTFTLKNLAIDANNAVDNALQFYNDQNPVVLQNITVRNAGHTGLIVNRSSDVTLSGLTGTGNAYYDIFAKAPSVNSTSLTASGIACNAKLFKANPGSGMTVTFSLNGTLMPATGGTELATANPRQESGTPGYTQYPSFDVKPMAPVCVNNSVTYTTQAGATNYAWSVPGIATADYTITGGGIGITDNTVTLTWLTTGSKTVTVGYDKYTCTGLTGATNTLTVNALPVAGAITGANAVCMGSTLSLASNATGTATLTYTWASSDPLKATVDNTGLVTPVAPGTTNITYTVTDGSSTACHVTSAAFAVTVNALPTASAGGSQSICSDGAAVIGGTSAAYGTIVWSTSNGGGTLDNGTTLTPTYHAAAADEGKDIVLTMTVTSNNTCTPQTATATYTVHVDPLPVAACTGSATICAGLPVTVSGASASNGTILWTTRPLYWFD